MSEVPLHHTADYDCRRLGLSGVAAMAPIVPNLRQWSHTRHAGSYAVLRPDPKSDCGRTPLGYKTYLLALLDVPRDIEELPARLGRQM